MNASSQFNNMLKGINTIIGNYAFYRDKNAFYKTEKNNLGIIDFQESHAKEKRTIKFTVNLGIVSYRLLNFFSPLRPDEKATIIDAQWRIRLGYLLPDKKDIWWTIDEQTNKDQLAEDLLKWIINLGVPIINKYINDEALRDLWLSNQSPSITGFQRLLYLTYFFKTIGPAELLEETITELRRISANKPTSLTAEIFLEKLMKQ